MVGKERYVRAKARLLREHGICPANRKLFGEYLEHQEYVLKRARGNATLDENSYKTLVTAITRLRTVNRWFGNKSWQELTKRDVQRVYDDLEDGHIKTRLGKPLRDKSSYYRILRGKPFEMAGKGDMAKEVLRFAPRHRPDEVRFMNERDFRRLIDACSKREQRMFLWLCWDIGENARSVLQLCKCNCVRQVNADTKEPEYLINLPKEILKRSRKPRSELTNYPETVTCLDQHLSGMPEDGLLFDFGEGWAKKFLLRAVEKTGVRCLPGGHRPTLKDLRSSMACDLLSKGWSRDEVNARLGHTPSSREIDRYINYLAIDRVKPKLKMQTSQMSEMAREMGALKEQLRLTIHRLQSAKQASQGRFERLAKISAIQCQISSASLEHQLGTLDEKSYTRELTRLHRALLAAEASFQSHEESFAEAGEASTIS